MTSVVPPRFLFRFAFPVLRVPAAPRKTGTLVEWADEHALPSLQGLDGAAEYARWYAAWNEAGLAIAVTVTGKKLTPHAQPAAPQQSDGIQLWIDTRCTQTVHRATRFCHQFWLTPVGGGRSKQQPAITAIPLAHAREEAARSTDDIQVRSELLKDGYRVEAWFPSESLTGYDPENHPRLGFYGLVRDTELGEQPLTVGREFPFEFDPSLWQTLELMKE